MNENRNQRIQKLFLHALDMPAAERETWLRSECGDDQAMVGEVLDLLRHDQPTADPLERGLDGELLGEAGLYQRPDQSGLHVRCPHCHHPIELVDDAELSDVECESCGSSFSLIAADETKSYSTDKTTKIAHFDLIERVGIGAFGSVFKARDKKLDRIVAVKVPRKGQLSGDEVEKFLREARTAAQLKHPNIVAVHEVGREDNRVFIVSDFVEGVTLSDWLTGLQPTPQETAELCITIARALQYAHEHGVIHRDLKPGNIMLDRNNQPFLMDFGLAKREAAEITMTMEGQVLGTPAYMSPEQARGDAHEVDGTTDIYAVGVILFEMLTGERPFRGNLRMLLHQVLTEEAPSPRRYNASIPRDLETICLKCLEKTPARRYGNADDVAEDLQRFIEHKPIDARPITRIERGWRWCKRKPAIASLVALLFLAMGIGTAVSSYFAVDANLKAQDLSDSLAKEKQLVTQKAELVDEKQLLIDDLTKANNAKELARNEAIKKSEESEKVLSFFLSRVLAASRPEGIEGGLGNDISLQDAIDRAEPLVGDFFTDQRLAEAAIRHAMGVSFRFSGTHKKAVAQLEQAVDLRCAELGLEHEDTLNSMYELAIACGGTMQYELSKKLHEKVYGDRRRVLGAGHVDTLRSMLRVAIQKDYHVSGHVGDSLDAKTMIRKAWELSKENLGESHEVTLDARYWLSIVYSDLDDDPDKAAEIQREILELCETHLGPENPRTVDAISALASTLRVKSFSGNTESLPEAVELYRKVWKAHQKRYGQFHAKTLHAQLRLGDCQFRIGQRESGGKLSLEAVQNAELYLGLHHSTTLYLMRVYARQCMEQGNNELAIEMMERSWPIVREFNIFSDAVTLEQLGNAYRNTNRLEEAEQAFRDAIKIRRKTYGDRHGLTIGSKRSLRRVLIAAGKFEDACEIENDMIEIRRKSGNETWQLALDLHLHGITLLELKRFSDASQVLRECLTIWKKRAPESQLPAHAEFLLGRALAGEAKFPEAEPLILGGFREFHESKKKIPKYPNRLIFPKGDENVAEQIREIVSFYESFDKSELANEWKEKLTSLESISRLERNPGEIETIEHVNAALQLADNLAQIPSVQPPRKLLRDIYARSLQWRKAMEASESMSNCSSSWQHLAILFMTGQHEEYKTARTKILAGDFAKANASHCYHSLLAALLLPLNDADHDSVRLLAQKVFQGTKDWEKQMAATAMYRLGEFDEWMNKLPEDSPLREKNHFQRACFNFKSKPSDQTRRALNQIVEREEKNAENQIKEGVLPQHWHNYVQRIGWIEEGKRLLSSTDKNGSN